MSAGDGFHDQIEKLEHTNDIVLLGREIEPITDMDDNPIVNLGETTLGVGSVAEKCSSASESRQQSSRGDCTSAAESTGSCETCPMKEQIRALVFWRKPLRSAAVLSLLLVAQLSFVFFSAISVFAYLGFILFGFINFCRLYYRYVAQSENNLFSEYVEHDISIPNERAADVARRLTDMANRYIAQVKEMLLFTNVAASIKFITILYLMTYIGARFNFLTLCILMTTVAFLVPKFYESYKTEIDRALKFAGEKANFAMSKVKAKLEKIPIFGSTKEKAQ